MQYLLDTNVLLWYIQGEDRLSETIKHAVDNPDNDIYVSVASIWEVSIKYSIKQLELYPDLDTYLEKYVLNGLYKILNILPDHARFVAKLAFHHRDPFDRLIYAQSVVENIELLYTDAIFEKYKNSI